MSSGKTVVHYQPAPEEPGQRIISCKSIVKEALNKKWWIYDPSGKARYIPEEFLTKYERVISGNEKFFNQVQIKAPHEGIQAGYKRLLNIQIELEDFTRRVMDYY